MTYVKSKEDVKNEQDLQNLVIGIIFRMDKPYKSSTIVECANYHLKGSSFFNNIELIQEHVDDTLDLLQNRDSIACINGTYYSKDPRTHRFSDEYYKRKRRITGISC